MVPSRRRYLSLLAAATVPFAGCSADGSGSSNAAAPTPTEDARSRAASGDADLPPYGYLRRDERAPIVRFADDRTDDGGGGVHYPEVEVVDSRERAEGMTYHDVDGAASVREFVESTDFDSACVCVDQRTVLSCYVLDLCAVDWSETSVDLSFGRVPLPYDVTCEADVEVMEARFVRIPEPLDADAMTGFSSTTSGSGCPRSSEPTVGTTFPGSADGTTDARGTSTTEGGDDATTADADAETTAGDGA